MWIDKDLIPFLIGSVEKYIDMDLVWISEDGSVHENDIDPNDWMIFDGFVLPVLRDNVDSGFEEEQMLYKGFGFMMHLIPYFIKSSQEPVGPILEGKLLKAYLEYSLSDMLSYVKMIPDGHVKENVSGIFERIDWIKRSVA